MMKNILKILCIYILCNLWGNSPARAQEQEDSNFELSKKLTIFHNILKEINLLYIDSVNNTELMDAATEAILKKLDPYSTHIHGYHMVDFKVSTEGEYAGIGARWWTDSNGNFNIQEVFPESPSQQAGIRIGDQAKSINGESVEGMSFGTFITKLVGTPNTPVQLSITRTGKTKEIIDFTIVRRKIELNCVLFKTILKKDIGYIALTQLTNKAEWQLKEAIVELQNKGAKSLIIDLRSNPGGFIKQGVKTANLFIGKDIPVLETKARIKQFNSSYTTTKEPTNPKIPIVILIGSRTSSAAEIFAGILQDMDRAVLIGEKSYGKGVIQKTRELGFGEKLKLTTAQSYILSGRSIQGIDHKKIGKENHIEKFQTKNGRTVYAGGGITPDIYVAPQYYRDLTMQLYFNNQVSYFVNWLLDEYKITKDFKITDEIYNEFKQFIKDINYKYQNKQYLEFLELKKSITSKNYKDISNKEEVKLTLNKLDGLLKRDMDKDLDFCKPELIQIMKEDISENVWGINSKYLLMVSNDNTIEKATEVLHNEKLYRGILDGSVPAYSAKKPKLKK